MTRCEGFFLFAALLPSFIGCGAPPGEVSYHAAEDVPADATRVAPDPRVAPDAQRAGSGQRALTAQVVAAPRTECRPYTDDGVHEVVHVGYCQTTCPKLGLDMTDPDVACVSDGLTWCCRLCVEVEP